MNKYSPFIMFTARYPHNIDNFIPLISTESVKPVGVPEGTNPVLYSFHEGTMSGAIYRPRGEDSFAYLMWYLQDFLGHLHFNKTDFETFNNVINPGLEFTSYLVKMIRETKSHYSQSVYIHIDNLWQLCEGNDELWEEKVQELRKQYSVFLLNHILTLEGDGYRNHSYLPMKYKLQSIYGDEWGKYLWQVATMNTLGMFIIQHDQIIHQYEQEIIRKHVDSYRNEKSKELVRQMMQQEIDNYYREMESKIQSAFPN